MVATTVGESGEPRKISTIAAGIDHLVYTSTDLERGMDEIEQLLGTRPVPGGRHPQYSTHNALLSLGDGTYLEIIARDFDLPIPSRGALVDLPAKSESRLLTWVFRTKNIHELAKNARSAGLGIGSVETGSREEPDGSKLSWQLTDPYALPLDGAIPFLIHWGDTIHPSGVVPSGGQLIELSIEHPQARRVQNGLDLLDTDVKAITADAFRISAKIRTNHGSIVTLQ